MRASHLLVASAAMLVSGSVFAGSLVAGKSVSVDNRSAMQELNSNGKGTTSSLASVLYDNVPGPTESVFTTTSTPRTSGGDEAYFAAPSGALVTSMEFGYSIGTGGPAAFDCRVQAYDQFGTGALGTDPTFVNKVADFTVSFTGQTAGAWITAPIDLTGLPGGGVSVAGSTIGAPYTGNATTFWTFSFRQPGLATPVAGNLVTFLFDGTGVNVGTNEEGLFGLPNDLYGRDGAPGGDGLNEIISNGELRTFGGTAGSLANFVLHLEGTLVPEPASMGLLAAALPLIARRRKA